MAPLGDSWGVVVGAASFDAREALLADVPTLPTLASTQRYVVVAAGVRYVGVSPIGLTTGIMREFVQGDGRSAIAQCPFATDLFDDTTVPPLVLAEVTVCGVVESAATDGLRLRMTEIATGRSVLLALHEGVGRDPDRQMTQAAPPSGGAIGSIGSPASPGVRVAIGPWFSATLDSVERLTIDGIPAGSVILRARWTLTTSAADRAAERAALSYGIFAGDRYQRYVGPCPTGALPTAPKLGTSTPIEQCAAVPAGEATTIYIHEGSGHAVGYFVIPAQ